ncbi:MAG: hypothetical protein AAGI17_00265 [Planctomycetota bacterium]
MIVAHGYSVDSFLIDWSLIITLLTLPLIFSMILLAARKLERRNRRKNNLCLDCGYDLANQATDTTTCPECGTVTE